MPSNLLIIALLAGFCFLHSCYYFKFQAQALDGYRLLLYCSVAGAILLGSARILVCAAKLSPLFWLYRPLANQFADIPYLGTSVLSIPIAFTLSFLWNSCVSAETCRAREVDRSGDSFLSLIQRAVQEERMLSVSFDTRKWYVGYVAEAPNLKPSEKFFRLMPVLSRYRDNDSLIARRTLSYANASLLADVEPSDFVITLPLKDVKTANLFDPFLYRDYFAYQAEAAA